MKPCKQTLRTTGGNSQLETEARLGHVITICLSPFFPFQIVHMNEFALISSESDSSPHILRDLPVVAGLSDCRVDRFDFRPALRRSNVRKISSSQEGRT